MRTPTILCTDNEHDVLLTLRAQLQRHFPDYTIEITESGVEALELVEELVAAGVEVPLIIADHVMLEMKGDQFLIELHRRHPQILKVMLTGQASAEAVGRVINQGKLYRFLSKPWNETDLQLTVSEALRHYQQERYLEQAHQVLQVINTNLEQQVQACRQELQQHLQLQPVVDPSPAPSPPAAKLFQLALQESEERNRAILSAVPDIMTILSADGHYLSISFNQFAGEIIPTNLGEHVTEVLPPAAACACLVALQRALETGEIQTHEQQIPFGDRIQYEEVRIVPYQTDKVLCMVRDITAKKQAELQLQQASAELECFFSVALDLLCIANLDGYFLRINPAWERTLGYSLEELQRRQFLDFVHPDDLEHTLNAVTMLADKQEIPVFVNRYRHRDGSYRWIEWRSIPVGSLIYAAARDITERKQAEETLAIVEAQQRSILENIPGFVAQVNRAGIILFLNRTAPGFTMAEVVGHHLDEFTAPESQQVQRQALEQVFATGEVVTIETLGTGANHAPAYYEVHIAPVYHQDQVEAAILVTTDITLRKQAEIALRQGEAQQRALISALPDLIMRISDDGVYLDFFAPNTFKTIGKTGDFIGTRVDESLSPDLAQKRMKAICMALQTGELQVYEQEILVDGVLQIEECRVVVCGENEVLVIGRDISGRKRAEAALRESEERRRLALDLTATGSWEFTVATGEAIWSDSHYRLMGLAPGERPSNYQTWRERVHPEDLVWVEQSFTQALETHSLLKVEYRVNYPDGTVRWMLTKGQGIYNAEGQAERMLGVMVDVTDRKLAEQALQQLNEELELRVQQRTQDLLVSQLQLQAKEQFLRGIFEGTDNPIFVVDVLENGRFEYTGWNHASEVIANVRSTEALGKSPQEVFPGDTGMAMERNYCRCCEMGKMIRYEEYLTFETGDAWTLTTLTPLRNSENQIYRIIGSVFNISERKQAELALQEAQRFAQSIADHTPNIIYIYDLEADCNIYVNREVFEILGYSPEAIRAMDQTFLETSVHPDDFAQFDQLTQQVKNLGDGEILEVEYRMQHVNGTWHWLYDRVSVFKRDEAGAVIQYIGAAQDITARKLTEAALDEKNTILQSVIESTPDVVYVKDAEGRYVMVNSGFADFFGKPVAQLLGKTDAELLPAEIAAQISENDRQTIQSGLPYTIEETVPHPDGSLRVYLTTKSPWHIPQTNLIGIVGLARDITERKQSEQALFESEQRYATLAAAAPVGIYRTNLQGECLYINERWCEIAGLTAAEAMGTGWTRALHPDDHAIIAQAWNDFVQTGERFRLEYRFRRPDGTVSWVFGQAVQERDENGTVKGYVGTVTDISDRKQAEAQLREQEQFLRSIYEGVQQPIFVGDVLPDQSIRIAGWNPSTARLIGIPSEEVAGKAVEDLFPPEQAAEMLDRYAQCITTRQPATFEERITFQGQIRWMLSTYNPLINADGWVHRVVGTVYDITERKQLEQDLLQINAELEQRVADRTQDLQNAMEAAQSANRAKTVFLSNMSHELRTPLNAILGFSQLLNRDSNLTLEQQEQIKIINRSGEHLLNLINDVLAMSKIEAGRSVLTVNSFDLRELLRDLEELFRLKAEAKLLRLTTQMDIKVPDWIQTDESKLRQVLINLIGNAIKFTEQGHVMVRVTVDHPTLQTLDNTLDNDFLPPVDSPALNSPALNLRSLNLHFEVEDTGFGIAPAEQNMVFEPFGQTQAGRNSQEGTGLGLPISRQFVQLMGGELQFTSTLNQGSTFYFTIPVRPVEADDQVPNPLTARVIGLATDQPYRLLVVEDKADNRRFLVQLLRSVGFEVQAVVNGQEAVERWQTWNPDLIWMDMRMPVMDGYTATRQIRRLEQQAPSPSTRPTTKILALTASAFEDDRAPILAAGCDDVLFKPITEALLFEKMAQHLGLCYRYQEVSVLSSSRTEPTDGSFMEQELQRMPLEWVTQLHQAARIVDEELMLEVIAQLPPAEVKLANALKELVNTFQIEKLIELTQLA